MTDTAPDAGPEPLRRRRRSRALIVWSAVGFVLVVVAVASTLSAARTPPGAADAPSALVGRRAPALSGDTVTGGHASLASYRGRWVIVNFFASWCVPCQKETPELVRFATSHRGAKDPQILGVVYQDDDSSVRDFVRDHHVIWPLLGYRSMDVANAYGVTGVPVTFLISPDGQVASKLLGGLGAGQLDTLLAAAQTITPGSTARSGP